MTYNKNSTVLLIIQFHLVPQLLCNAWIFCFIFPSAAFTFLYIILHLCISNNNNHSCDLCTCAHLLQLVQKRIVILLVDLSRQQEMFHSNTFIFYQTNTTKQFIKYITHKNSKCKSVFLFFCKLCTLHIYTSKHERGTYTHALCSHVYTFKWFQ